MDLTILKFFHATFHSQTWLNYIMSGITWLGEFGAAGIVLAVFLVIFKKTRTAGFAVAVALLLDLLLVNIILKNAVNRPRPWTEWPEIIDFYNSVGMRIPSDSSFPSGHTGACFAAAVALFCRYPIKAIPALVVAFLVAISRIYLCVHYPTDVLAGLLIGSACGVAGHFIVKAVCSAIEKRKSSS